MTEQVVRSEVKYLPARLILPWLVGVGVYLLLIAIAPQLLNDPDSYWQVAVGNWIIGHGAVPTSDPFSFTMHGAHWIAFEWLSEIVYAATMKLAGWTGVAVLAAAATALAFVILAHFLMRELSPLPALVLLGATLLLLAPHILARPHVLALPVMVAWAAALVRSMDEETQPPYAALPLLALWANLHGSVVLGIGLIGPAVLETMLREPRSAWPRVILQWAPFTALAILAACLTPYGAGSLLMPLKTLGLGSALNTIVEWRPQNFSHVGAFEVILLLGIYALSRGLSLPFTRILVILGLLHFALAQTRNADLLAMLGPLYLAQPLRRQLDAQQGQVALVPAIGFFFTMSAVVMLATALIFERPLSPDKQKTPQAAIEAADLAHAGPVLNDYAFGGYMIYAGIAPFIDGRGELYGADFIARNNNALSLGDLPDFLKMLDQYGIRATLLAPTTPAVALLDRLPDWQRVYSDGVAVVHKRRKAPPAK